MKISDEAFDDLEALAAPGPQRAELLGRKQVWLFAVLKYRDPARAARIAQHLHGWSQLTEWKKTVRAFETDSQGIISAEKREKRVADAKAGGQPVIVADEPRTVATAFLEARWPHLIHAEGGWLNYEVNCYRPVEELGVRAALASFMASGVDSETGEDFSPSKRHVDEAFDALRTITYRPRGHTTAAYWFDYFEGVDPRPEEVMSFTNGLLDLRSGNLYRPTPRFMTRNGLPYAYDPGAPEPVLWEHFLEEVWPEEDGGRAEKDALQEIMGYLLTGNTDFQSIFQFVGAKRSGKGTIARVITAMIGSANVASPSLNQLGEGFGKAVLIGKSLMVVADMRLDRGAAIGRIVETLLNLSGQDPLTIPIKFRDDFEGTLNTRILLLSNMGLVLSDKSGALTSRYVPLLFTRDFTNQRDPLLTDKLVAEMPGILNWSLEGLRRLMSRRDETGRPTGFILTPNGKKLLGEIHADGSSVQAFLQEVCDVEKGKRVVKKVLFKAFEGWCIENEVTSALVSSTFSKELRVASGYRIDSGRRSRVNHKLAYHYEGVAIKEEFADYEWPGDDL